MLSDGRGLPLFRVRRCGDLLIVQILFFAAALRVLSDESRIPRHVDHILTPALVENVIRAANTEALRRGVIGQEGKDLEVAWTREIEGQARRFGEDRERSRAWARHPED